MLTTKLPAALSVGTSPVQIAISPNGAFAYVTGFFDIVVSVLDTATNTVVATVPINTLAGRPAVTPDGAFVYVPDAVGNSVLVIDTAANAVTASVTVGTFPGFIAFPTRTQDPISSLIAQVEALIADGNLTQNQGDGLIDKLNQVAAKLTADQVAAACNQLAAFTNQVQSFINNGSLTPAEGQALIDAANAIRTNLGC